MEKGGYLCHPNSVHIESPDRPVALQLTKILNGHQINYSN
jgi:hypothetical protein